MLDFDLVFERIADAEAIAWDTCHKIYVLMDKEEVAKMREYGYGDENDPDSLITKDQMNSTEMFSVIKKWFEKSCSLRFISAVSSVPEGTDPNEGFESLISQFEEEDCEDCGERGCKGVCNDYEDTEDEEEDE